MTEPPNFRAFIQTFTDFLTVAIHTIIYERNIYPSTTFLSARKYNFPVRQSRHPRVCTWIQDAVTAVEAQLLKGTVSRVAVVIYSSEDEALERFMFDVSKFPVVPETEHYTPLERRDESGQRLAVLPLVDLEEQMRATMARLSGCGSLIGPVPEGCTFTVAVELKDESEPPIGQPQPWIPVEPKMQKTVRKDDDGIQHVDRGERLGGVKTVPVRTVAAGEMLFEMWIEEGQAKISSPEQQRGTATSSAES